MGKTVRTWMRMQAVTGDYPVPTSEAAYLTHSGQIDTVIPYGGTIVADGTWAQAPCLDQPFARSLPGWAESADQRYMPYLNPGHGSDGSAIRAVLDDSWLQAKAAADAVELATSRFDAPWDGITYDALGQALGDASYHDKQHDFIDLLSDAAHQAGLTFCVAFRGIRPEDEDWSAIKLDRIASVDIFDYYFYGWWLAPCSTGPYWWVVEGIENALRHGIPARSIYLGIANYARYWPDGYRSSQDMIHDQAIQIARENGARVRWVEEHETGTIREWYAAIGDGHLWIQDGDTVKSRLALVDEYDLGGAMLFIPGMGDESAWKAIAKWKRKQLKTKAAAITTDIIASRGGSQLEADRNWRDEMNAVCKLARKLKDRKLAEALVAAGLDNPAKIRAANDKDLEAIKGIGPAARRVIRQKLPKRE